MLIMSPGTTPVKNRKWWTMKINRNRLRDRQTTRHLQRQGWTVIRVWEHAPIENAVGRIIAAIDKRRTKRGLSA
jgi:DNA mismatch endonuclease (patch repair protein)